MLIGFDYSRIVNGYQYNYRIYGRIDIFYMNWAPNMVLSVREKLKK